MTISRSGLPMHLSEHHGDASPGSTAYVTMHGIDAFWSELAARDYSYRKPGIATVDRGRVLTVIDPFSNQVRFREPRGRTPAMWPLSDVEAGAGGHGPALPPATVRPNQDDGVSPTLIIPACPARTSDRRHLAIITASS